MKEIRPVIISAFGPPALACLRSWGRAGMIPGMISIHGPGEPKPASRYLASSICMTREDLYTERGLSNIIQFLEGFGASGLTCIDENVAQWLNREQSKLPGSVKLWVPPKEMLNRALDKILQIEAALQVGLNVLPTYLFSGGDVTNAIPDEHFPLCLRPSAPDSVTPHFKVTNVDSNQQLIDFLGTLSIRKPVIGQPFQNLPNLVVHGTRTEDGKSLGMSSFLVERKFQGVTLTLRPVPLTEDLRTRCAAFIEKMSLVGHYHFEFLKGGDNGENHFLEINHRFGGTTAKTLVCGYQEPIYALLAQGVEIQPDTKINNRSVSSIKALFKSAQFAMTDRLTPLDFPEESKTKRLWSALKCLIICRDEIFDWKDLQGTVAFYFGDVPGRFKRTVDGCRRWLFPARG